MLNLGLLFLGFYLTAKVYAASQLPKASLPVRGLIVLMPLYSGFIIYFVIHYRKEHDMMTTMKKTLVALAVGVLLLAGALMAFVKFLDTTSETAYPDYTSATGMIERGWIPEVLPKDAVDVYNVSDVGNNKTFEYFKVPEESLGAFEALLEPSGDAHALEPLLKAGRQWKNAVAGVEAIRQSARAYKDDAFEYLVFDDGTVFYWGIPQTWE